jgi:hypothetical protein
MTALTFLVSAVIASFCRIRVCREAGGAAYMTYSVTVSGAHGLARRRLHIRVNVLRGR